MEFLDALLMDFGGAIAKKTLGNSVPGHPRRNALGAWILSLPRIRLHTSSHALLPQKGGGDPPKGGEPPPHFLF